MVPEISRQSVILGQIYQIDFAIHLIRKLHRIYQEINNPNNWASSVEFHANPGIRYTVTFLEKEENIGQVVSPYLRIIQIHLTLKQL